MASQPKSTAGVLISVADRLRVMVTPHVAPPLTAVERVLDPWLARQLNLYNASYKLDDHANAIRILYLLWEDPALRPPGTEDFRYVRHFVSHARIDAADTVTFIESQLGPGTDHYQPFNQAHHTFVRDWRHRVEEALEVTLRRQFGI
jgi:hypothetical protein